MNYTDFMRLRRFGVGRAAPDYILRALHEKATKALDVKLAKDGEPLPEFEVSITVDAHGNIIE